MDQGLIDLVKTGVDKQKSLDTEMKTMKEVMYMLFD